MVFLCGKKLSNVTEKCGQNLSGFVQACGVNESACQGEEPRWDGVPAAEPSRVGLAISAATRHMEDEVAGTAL